MKKERFGSTPDGKDIFLYEIKSGEAVVKITDFGAAVVSFYTHGRDIVGGYDSPEGYFADDSHQGATIGRVSNRIADARFSIDGKEYLLPKNNGENCIHGGEGIDRRMWDVIRHTDDSITLGYISPDGEEGFPAKLDISVSFTLTGDCLQIDYTAVPDGKTPISLTNHSYFNLEGLGGNVLGHKVRIYADKYTEVDGDLIPTGTRLSVEGTPYDLRAPRLLGDIIGKQLDGFDNNYILCPQKTAKFGEKTLGLAADAFADGLCLEAWTDQPCVQLYTGNFLGNGPCFKGGVPQVKHGAFCIEAQTEPNCINHGESIYEANEVYTQTTVYLVKKTACPS